MKKHVNSFNTILFPTIRLANIIVMLALSISSSRAQTATHNTNQPQTPNETLIQAAKKNNHQPDQNTPTQSSQSQTRHLILISIDALTPDTYLDPKNPTPNLQTLKKQGTHTRHMTSTFPAYTYPAHAAMLTGQNPSSTNITYNAPRNSKGEWNWHTTAIQTPTLWTTLKNAHLSTAAIQWPISVSPEITYNIPEIWNPNTPQDRITQTRRYATPGLLEEIEKNATGTLSPENMDEEHFSMDQNASRAAAYIFSTYRPSFLALHFASLDGTGHHYGRGADSTRLALASIDAGIGHLLEAVQRSGLQDSTTILITGDHGMVTMKYALRPNIWIKGLGARFHTAGGSCFLYPDDPKDTLAAQRITRRLKNLPGKYRRLFRIYDKEKLVQMGADREAVLALVAKDGYVFSGSETGEEMVSVHGGHHGYDPSNPKMYTGFIAAGAGIRKGGEIRSMNVCDVAAIIAQLLAVDFKTPNGKVPTGLFKSS